jgi:hypothetical protein
MKPSKRIGVQSMFMGGTITHKPASKPLEYPEGLNFGKHGTKTFSKQFAPTKHPMDTGPTVTISMEILIFIEPLWPS